MADGIINGMNVKIDKAGRIVVPKAMRERLGLRPDSELEIVEQPGGVLLRIVDEGPAMTRVNGHWVHRGRPLPGADLTRIVDGVREERIQSSLKHF